MLPQVGLLFLTIICPFMWSFRSGILLIPVGIWRNLVEHSFAPSFSCQSLSLSGVLGFLDSFKNFAIVSTFRRKHRWVCCLSFVFLTPKLRQDEILNPKRSF